MRHRPRIRPVVQVGPLAAPTYNYDLLSVWAEVQTRKLVPTATCKAATAYLTGFGDAFAVLSHGTGYPVQTCCNHPGECPGCFHFGLTAVLALSQADLQ